MNPVPPRDVFENGLGQLAQAPLEERLDALFDAFMTALADMEPPMLRQMRDEISSRFGGRYCRSEACSKMLSLINDHLAKLDAGVPRLAPVKS